MLWLLAVLDTAMYYIPKSYYITYAMLYVYTEVGG